MGGRGGWEGGLVGGSGGDYTATLTYTDDPHPPLLLERILWDFPGCQSEPIADGHFQ